MSTLREMESVQKQVNAVSVFRCILGGIHECIRGPLARTFVGAAGWSVTAAMVTRAATLISWVFCARMLTRDEFGTVTLIYSTVALLANVGSLGLGMTASRYVGEFGCTDPARAGRIIAMSALLSLGSGLLLGSLVFGFSEVISDRVLGRMSLAHSVRIGSLVVLFSSINAHQIGALSGLHAFRNIARLSAYIGVLSLATMLIGLHCGGATGAVWALSGWSLIAWAAYHLGLRRECRAHGIELDFRCWTKERSILWRFSMPALLTSFVVTPSLWLCTLMLTRLPEGYIEVAIFNVAERWHTAVLFIPSAMFSVVMPLLSAKIGEGNEIGFQKLVYMNLAVNMLLAGIPALLFIAGAPLLVGIFGSGYLSSAPVLRLLCVAAIPEIINGVIGQVVATTSMWMRFAFDVLLSVTMVGACYVVIPRWHAAGFAAAYALAFAVTSLSVCIYAVCTHTLCPLTKLRTLRY